MRSKARGAGIVVALVVAACCLAVAAPGGAQSPALSPADDAFVGDPVSQADGLGVAQTDDQPDPDNTITRIGLVADGSATWEITLRTRLATEDDLAEYERFQDRFRENTSRYLDPFTDRMTGVVAAANDTSDRKMRATEFEADTAIQEVPRRWGVVSFRFTWTGFAATDGDDVIVGDVFDGGFFIGDDDVLEITAPDGYAIATADPTPDELDNRVAEWHGREDFDDGRPSVRAASTDADGGSADGGDGGGNDGGNGGVGGSVDTALALAGIAGILLVVGLAAVAYAVQSGRLVLGGDESDDGGTETGPESGAAASAERPAAMSNADAGSSVQGETGPSAVPDESGNETTQTGDGTATAAVDPDLLTDEDHVRRALRDEGGRMKQSAIVEELGWSKSKTSRVLSQMADEGEVEKLRIGRENVIDLPDEE